MLTTDRVEFDVNGEPTVNTFDEFSYKSLSFMLKLLFFVGPLTIGLYEHTALMESPLMRISAIIMGFFFSVVSWLTACLLPVFVFGVDYAFAIDVFNLFRDNNFGIAIAFVFVLLLPSRFFTRSILRICPSYRTRRYVFITSCIINIACIASILEFMNSSFNPYVFLFNIVVIGIIFFILIRHRKDIRNTRTRPGVDSFHDDSQHDIHHFVDHNNQRMHFS